MLVVITHLNAPWPVGAKVGDVLELPEVPVWAAGKCEPAPEGVKATGAADTMAAKPARRKG